MNKLFAICLIVEDFDQSMAFYNEVFGLKIHEQNGKFADFTLGETSLAIFEKSEAVAMFPPHYMRKGGSAVIAFQTTELEKFVASLERRNIVAIEGPKTTPWGQKVVYYLDPDQNVIEISET